MKTYDEIKQAMQSDPKLHEAQLAVEHANGHAAKIKAFDELLSVANKVEHECSR